jgi:neurofibromin 1
MQHHWKHHQASSDENNGTTQTKHPTSNRASQELVLPNDGIPPVPKDPPRLEDHLAKHILYVTSRFIYQMGTLEEHNHGIVANHSTSIISTETYANSNGQFVPTGIMVDIYKAASRVVAYVSASNWNITFAKIKSRILYLTTTTEENPETGDIMLLECASLNMKRLGMVLAGK